MLGRLLRPRTLIAIVSVALILIAVSRLFEIRTPDRPEGTWQDIAGLAERDDLNVVFILIDTLRADRLSAYGYERDTSPIMAALAESGIVFQNAQAQSTWTKTSMASLLTGTFPARNRVTRYPHGLADGVTTPAEHLKAAGFRTVGLWRNGWIAPNFGFGQGFDLYFNPKVLQNPRVRHGGGPSAMRLPGTDQDATVAAGEFLNSVRPGERFFLYLHYMDVHQYVYDQSADFGTTFSDIYDNSIHWVDANVGTLIAMLQREELMRNTLVVIGSDHGEAFLEHGREGHARDLYVETTHVPMIMLLPFRLEEPIVVETPVQNVDVWPTIYDIVGLEPPNVTDGKSLLPLIEAAGRGDPPPPAETRFAQLDRTWGQRSEAPQPLVAIEDGPYRLFHHLKAPEQKDGDLADFSDPADMTTQVLRTELYNVEEDPGETQNIARANPDVVKELQERVIAYLQTPEADWGKPKMVPLSDMQLGQLRALGYAVEAGDELPEDEDEGDE